MLRRGSKGCTAELPSVVTARTIGNNDNNGESEQT
jgi:hypothetical protein